ncbi:MAG TPA: ester cyclase [Thermomicrobiales bacterium]|jgi:steroid delta-isomerase-like uncharacterized protein
MSVEANKALVLSYIEDVWNGRDMAALDRLLAPTYYTHSYEPRNRAGLEGTLALTTAAFPDHQTIIEAISAEGDTVATCETFRGTHTGPFRGLPASGKPFAVGRYQFFTVADGAIVAHRGLLDLPSLLRQIGAAG